MNSFLFLHLLYIGLFLFSNEGIVDSAFIIIIIIIIIFIIIIIIVPTEAFIFSLPKSVVF